MLRYVKPGFINPVLLDNQKLSLKNLLEEEAIAMAFPVDSRYFNQFPLIYNTNFEGHGDVAGRQYPRPERQANLQGIVYTKYGEKSLDVKTFPYLHHGVLGGGTMTVKCLSVHTLRCVYMTYVGGFPVISSTPSLNLIS